MTAGSAEGRTHWQQWHDDYADPASVLSQRLAAVVARLRLAIDEAPPGTDPPAQQLRRRGPRRVALWRAPAGWRRDRSAGRARPGQRGDRSTVARRGEPVRPRGLTADAGEHRGLCRGRTCRRAAAVRDLRQHPRRGHREHRAPRPDAVRPGARCCGPGTASTRPHPAIRGWFVEAGFVEIASTPPARAPTPSASPGVVGRSPAVPARRAPVHLQRVKRIVEGPRSVCSVGRHRLGLRAAPGARCGRSARRARRRTSRDRPAREQQRVARHVVEPGGLHVDPVVVAADPDVRRCRRPRGRGRTWSATSAIVPRPARVHPSAKVVDAGASPVGSGGLARVASAETSSVPVAAGRLHELRHEGHHAHAAVRAAAAPARRRGRCARGRTARGPRSG